ncbi:Ig-like domain-containing protein [Jatrophihabitans endophyticus]|uniref:Ig-like domain-containing protein n=1 Tax=Jatrophihabitans endophyticus TaxID=1206085 RepID=UPI0019EDD31A|nr:Ig-like domain-containing protein [Jatrophihabitans endophyticus]MBE7186905.1 Ig-like domain-containing protein [Jatrophihabitans endophyticus]
MLPTSALAAGGTWGPDATPYRNGVVCTSGSVDTALVSWNAAGGGPGFGASPIQSGFGSTGEPSTSGIAVPVQASSTGLDSATVAQLAYLISTHGDDTSAGVVGDVADGVLQLTGTATSSVDQCLAAGIDGTSTVEAAKLVAEARRLAGPYSVELTGPSTPTPAGRQIALTASVTSAAGDPVPDLTVTFSPSGAGTQLSSSSATTDAQGDAQVFARSAGGAAAADAGVTATVSASTGLTETTTGGTVAVIQPAAPQRYSDHLALDVDTRPDPVLQLTDSHTVLLNDGTLGQSLTVTGMNGHQGSATVSLYGPLKLARSGCGSHTAADWAAARAAHTTVQAPQVSVTGDGSYPVPVSPQLSPGCYESTATLQTTDASPNVSAKTTGDVVTVAPVTVAAAPDHGGLAPVGSLQTVLHATSSFTTSWQGVQGEVLGPRAATDGTCPTTGWGSASSAASITSTAPATGPSDTAATDGSTTSAVTVSSGAVTAAGCYAFRLTATLSVTGVGTTTVSLGPGSRDTAVHVIAPTVSVTALSTSGVDSGGHLAATVDVASSDGQPGSLRLELLRLPYTYRGCFGADWAQAPVVRTRSTPVLPTKGDNTYRVSTAAVPGSACWTVVPVFTASANPAVRAQATAGDDPMLAFTSTVRPRSNLLESATAEVGSGTAREVSVGLVTLAAVVALMLVVFVAARIGRRNHAIDPRDRLLG